MAQITIQVGALNRSLTAADAQMTAVLGDVVAATGGPTGGTPAQRADWVLQLIRRYLVEVANGERRRAALDAAERAVERVELE